MATSFRIWGLGDPHLSFAQPKPMDIFGAQWTNHEDKIAKNCAKVVAPEDLLLIPGDISWAMKRADALVDLSFLAKLPGKKVLIKGNHDYWWDSDRPLNYPGLFDTPFVSEDGTIGVAGTRGWDEAPEGSNTVELAKHQKHVTREMVRLENRLKAIAECKIRMAMIHYPPLPDFAPLLKRYCVSTILYGHLHLGGNERTLPEDWFGMRCICVAADRIQFMPRLIETVG